MNELLFFLSILITFSFIVAISHFFGKEGLIVWMGIAAVLANLLLPKIITLFGFDVNMGSILFSSMYLSTDIISERFGLKESRRAVFIALIADLVFIAASQIGIAFIPSGIDGVHEMMDSLFSITVRVTAASVAMFFISNMADVYLFNAMKRRWNKQLWLRNNVCTILCNCLENYLFVFAALGGTYSFSECLELASVGCVIEIIISLCDTPFVYLGRRFCKAD